MKTKNLKNGKIRLLRNIDTIYNTCFINLLLRIFYWKKEKKINWRIVVLNYWKSILSIVRNLIYSTNTSTVRSKEQEVSSIVIVAMAV